MKILCLIDATPGTTPAQMGPHLREEALHSWHGYEQDIIREWYFRGDRPGVVFVLECPSVEEAQRFFADFPLAKANLITCSFVPLKPFTAIGNLFAQKPAT